MDDNAIITLYLKRDETAVSETKHKYTKYCGRIAANILTMKEDAEEALNDTWMAAWNCIPPNIPKCLQTFLGKLTRNISLKKVRADMTQKRGSSEVRIAFEEIANCIESDKDVESKISELELVDFINSFLDELSDIERNVFIRRYWYFNSISGIAEYHKFSESKIKSILFRVRKKLYSKLQTEGYI